MRSKIHQILGSDLVLELNFRASLALLEEIKLKMILYLCTYWKSHRSMFIRKIFGNRELSLFLSASYILSLLPSCLHIRI